MARKGAFKSEKRKKEVTRQKKQEEKRQRRLHKDASSGENTESGAEAGDESVVGPGAETVPATEPEGAEKQPEP